MRVLVFPADLGGCGYYRLIWPSQVLKDNGLSESIKLIHPNSKQRISGTTDETGKLTGVNIPKGFDVVVFQRVSSTKIVDVIKILRANGIAVVIDIDDDMKAIAQSNPAWAMLHPKSTGNTSEYNWNAAQDACDAATLVTVSTDALLRRYAVHGRGVILRNAIPKVMLEIPHTDSDVIGWPGTVGTHPDDPQVVGTSMALIQREGYKFRIIGSPRGAREAFKLDQEPLCDGMTTPDRWPHEVTRLGVGIAPLNDTRFNEAKSWLKMLEMAALRVPCIGSPRAEYRRLHALGVGLLANTPRDWLRQSRALLKSETFRKEVAEQGFAAVQDLTIEKTAWRWWEAWTEAYEIEKAAKRP